MKETDSQNSEQNISDAESGSNTDKNSDYEIIDVTENPLYQVLSVFFETEEGENICDILKKLTLVFEENTKIMQKLLKNNDRQSK